MSNYDRNLAKAMRADPELRHQLSALKQMIKTARFFSEVTTRILSVRLPFLAHPSYRMYA